jgi:eukaryotic-like serine/threonine-protein kinase
LLSQAEPESNAAERNVTVRELLDRAAAGVDEKFRGQPEVENAVRRRIARTYHGLGAFDQSERHSRAVCDLQRRRSGSDSAKAWDALAQSGHQLGHLGRIDEALKVLSQSRDALVQLRGPEHSDTVGVTEFLAAAYRESGQFSKAIPLYEEALRLRKANAGGDAIITMANMAQTYNEAGRTSEAIPLLEKVLEDDKSRRGPDHPNTITSMNNLALAYRDSGQPEKAL